MDEFLVQIIVSCLFGAICASIAVGRGRSGVAWFFIGALLTCIGLVLVLVLPDLKAQEERHRRLTKENRRLKEALRKDRQVADQRHRETKRRLSAHDRALDVDTGPRLEAAAEAARLGEGEAGLDGAGPVLSGDTGAREWYYLVGEQQVGPVSLASLGSLWNDGVVDGSTYVWRQDLSDWRPIAEVDELEGFLRG